jgi:hypothetical protein
MKMLVIFFALLLSINQTFSQELKLSGTLFQEYCGDSYKFVDDKHLEITDVYGNLSKFDYKIGSSRP